MKFVYIDDSQITLGGREHVILAGLVVDDPTDLFANVSAIRKKHGIGRFEELKSASKIVNNDNGLLEDISFLVAGKTCTCLCSINDSVDKAKAAELFIKQVLAYSRENKDEYYLLFDKGIISGSFDETILQNDKERLIVGFQSLDSKYDYGIQIADWFATQFKTSLVFRMKKQDRKIVIYDMGKDTEMGYNFFSSMSIRQHWWGDILNSRKENTFLENDIPIKYIVGKGIFINSDNNVIRLIEEITSVYMGCIH